MTPEANKRLDDYIAGMAETDARTQATFDSINEKLADLQEFSDELSVVAALSALLNLVVVVGAAVLFVFNHYKA